MTLLRRVLGETLRGRRLRQRRTLREVSGAARVSLGYLSEVERGQKEASSELLASICEALDVKLSDLLREVSETMWRSERAAEVARMPGRVILPAPVRRPVPAGVGAGGGPRTGPELPEFEAAFEEAAFEEAAFEEAAFEEAAFKEAAFEEAAFESEDVVPEQGSGPVGATDSLVDRIGPGDLDGVDLAELETGDGFGELEVVLARTDLAGRFDAPYAGRCLAAAAA